MIDHQLGRRNLSVEQMAYLRGMKYLALKQERENLELNRDKTGKFKSQETEANDLRGHFDHHGKKEKLSEQLAKEFNVGEKTIRRDADFARGLEMLPTDIKNKVLQGKSSLNKRDIIEVGKTKDVNLAQEKVQQLVSSNSIKPEKKEKQSKDKVLSVLKSYLTTAEECDDLIADIQNIKQTISKI